MSKVTDPWCNECGSHADVIENGTLYCASCYLEELTEEAEEDE